MNAKEAILNAVTLATGACAVLVTVHALRGGAASGAAAHIAPRPVAAADWMPLLSKGHRIGPADAKLTIIEFGDFQCPVCGNYERVIDSMRSRHPKDFAVVFQQFPLSYHPLAYPLARAAECAAAQGSFTDFHDVVYSEQEQLGVLPITSFATKAGLRDTLGFRACLIDTARVPAIDSGLAAGRRIGVPGTPAVIVDGMLHATDLRVADLERILAAREH